jgi:hypothetical protein
LDWLRNNNADNVATDDPSAASYSVAGACDLAFVQQNARDVVDALDWLRQNVGAMADPDDQ